MRIKVNVNGKEIIGYWNEKVYKSKIDPNKNVRIYIDNNEYDIPREDFNNYEEVLTEKQVELARKLKDDFLNTLETTNIDFDKDKRDELIEYFKNKDEKYYLKNKHRLTGMKLLYIRIPELFYRLILAKDKILDYYESYFKKTLIPDPNITNNIIKETYEAIANEILKKIVLSVPEKIPDGISPEFYIHGKHLPREILIHKIGDKYFIRFDRSSLLFDTEGNSMFIEGLIGRLIREGLIKVEPETMEERLFERKKREKLEKELWKKLVAVLDLKREYYIL